CTMRPAPRSTLFPYTTLFRSQRLDRAEAAFLRQALHREQRHHEKHGQREKLEEDVGGRKFLRAGAVGFENPGEHKTHYSEKKHRDRKSTRLNSSHVKISYAVF